MLDGATSMGDEEEGSILWLTPQQLDGIRFDIEVEAMLSDMRKIYQRKREQEKERNG